MTISVVSQHGPNPQSGKPDRSVSLPVPDPRESAAEMMGGIGNVGNLTLKRLQKRHATLIDRYESLAPDAVNAPYNQEWDELLDEITEVEEQIRKAQEQNPQPPPVEVTDLSDPAARKAALAKWGAPHLGPVPDLPPDTVAMGATAPSAVQSMLTHMASGEPPRTGRAHPERPEAPRVPEPAVPLSDEQMERNKQGFKDARKVLNPESTMSSIWDTIMNVVPDVDPKTAIMVASAVAALLAAGTGVGGPLAPVILGGGAALASQ